MKVKSFANVWDAIMDTPEEAAAMTMRSDLLITLTEHVKAWKLTQAAARNGQITKTIACQPSKTFVASSKYSFLHSLGPKFLIGQIQYLPAPKR